MKKLFGVLLLCYMFINYAHGQPPMPPGVSTSGRTSWEELKVKYNNPVVLIDSKLIPDSAVKRTLDDLNTLDIIKITVLHSKDGATRNTLYVITKDPKIAAYQKKLGTFSEKYKSYLETHQNRDVNLFFIIDATPLQGGRQQIIDALYNIPAKKIEGVSVSFIAPDTDVNHIRFVTITTKK